MVRRLDHSVFVRLKGWNRPPNPCRESCVVWHGNKRNAAGREMVVYAVKKDWRIPDVFKHLVEINQVELSVDVVEVLIEDGNVQLDGCLAPTWIRLQPNPLDSTILKRWIPRSSCAANLACRSDL